MLVAALLLAGCSGTKVPFAYKQNNDVSVFQVTDFNEEIKMAAFADALCVGNANVTAGTSVDMTEASAAALFDVNKSNIIYAKNMHERLYPASLTKILTAVVALKHASPEDVITVTDGAMITESGATLCGLEAGDTLTMNQALHALLINSANDAANAIAIHIAGSVEAFSAMMNEEARSLGATNSNFVNPHGLSDDNHYTTAYDLYLIFNEAIQYEMFREIIHMSSYETIYQNSQGEDKEMSIGTTNFFLRGEVSAPDKVTIIGGKTGTTNAAGNCLILLSKDTAGNPYISVILRAKERKIMYDEMVDMLEEIYN
ncbi:MAG: D-alanyl-D-alanine carboxypeptidase [Lachnospiraceae bacterium]|nr:D-alanyl-D-alanine carboxypeptidase [Lachnospiraceae bacterium]